MAITALPAPPSTSNPTTFASKADALLGALPAFVTEANALAASMASIAAGGAFSIPYTFDTTTTDADPGAGKIRLGNATQNAATTIRIDTIGADATDWAGVIDSFDDSTSGVKGQIRLVKVNDGSKWLAFSVTALASPSGYRNLTVVPAAGSSASPFAGGDSLLLLFTRTGDMANYTPITYLHVRDEKSSGSAGGSTATGFQDRTLNTIKTNTISGASLASNQISLPAGTYVIFATAPASNCDNNRATLYNVTDSADVLVGTSEYASAAANINTRSIISGMFTLAAPKTLKISHYAATIASTNGLGRPASSGQVEVYTEVFIEKVA